MKGILALVLLVLLFALIFRDEDRKEQSDSSDQVVSRIAAPAKLPPARSEASAEEAPKQTEQEKAIVTPVVPNRYFPGAKEWSRMERRENNGDLRVIKTVETHMKEPFVRVEEVYRGGAVAEKNLTGQAAMVANQLLIALPDGVEEERLLAALRIAGAIDVKRAGEDYLATFPARPEDPAALEEFRERVISSADFELVIEPNYIRKLL